MSKNTLDKIQVGNNASIRQGDDHFYGPVIINSKATRVPDSIYDIPNLLSPNFTGRDDELELARSILERGDISEDSPARCIIYGLPGLGKTQFALKYAELAYQEKKHRYLFWISAASAEKLTEGFSRLLDLLNLAGHESRDQNARCATAKSWLDANGSGALRRWLLILDNANPETAVKLRDMLPRSNANGQILMTTRTQQTAESLASAFGKRHKCIGLRQLTAAESVQLLLRVTEAERSRLDPEELQKAEEVTRSVGCLPLVVDQAASQMQASGLGISEIAELYTDEQREKALALETGPSLYEGDPIMITYGSAIAQLRNSPPGTIDLLRVFAFLDPENIPIDILKDGILREEKSKLDNKPEDSTTPAVLSPLGRVSKRASRQDVTTIRGSTITIDGSLESLQRLFTSPVDLYKTQQDLQKLSLIARRKDGSTSIVWVHDLVQDILRKKLLESEEECKRWLINTTHILFNAFEMIENPRLPKCWDQCERFLSHMQTIQRYSKRYETTSKELLTTMSWIAIYLYERGRYKEAQKLDEEVLSERKICLGVDHPDTLNSMNNLASNYGDQGRLKEAEELQVQVLEISKRVLGHKHPDTLTRMANLASTYWNQRRLKEAEELEVQVVEISKRVLGDEHPDTLARMANLASTYSNQRRLKEAEELGLQVVEMSKRVLGDEHPNTLKRVANLALTYCDQGRLKEAEKLEVQAMEMSKRLLGDEHPDTLTIMGNLASTYWEQNERRKAIELESQVLSKRSALLGHSHPRTKSSAKRLKRWGKSIT